MKVRSKYTRQLSRSTFCVSYADRMFETEFRGQVRVETERDDITWCAWEGKILTERRDGCPQKHWVICYRNDSAQTDIVQPCRGIWPTLAHVCGMQITGFVSLVSLSCAQIIQARDELQAEPSRGLVRIQALSEEGWEVHTKKRDMEVKERTERVWWEMFYKLVDRRKERNVIGASGLMRWR